MDAAVSQFGLMFFSERFLAIRMMAEADLRGWLPVMDVVLPEEQIQRILEEAEGDLKPYRNADGCACLSHRPTSLQEQFHKAIKFASSKDFN